MPRCCRVGGARRRFSAPSWRETRRPASPSCAWTRASTPVPCWRREMDIGADDTAKSRARSPRPAGADLIVETLDALDSGRIREVPQPSAGVTYAEKINKAEALIDWQQDAAQIWRRIRAFNPWPIAETRLDGAQLRIWDAELPRLPMRAGGAPGVDPARCSPPRMTASTWRAAAACCGFFACSSPAESRSWPGNSSRDSGSTARASRPHERPRPPARVLSPRTRWRGYCARA